MSPLHEAWKTREATASPPRERCARITNEISGVASQYGVTSWELAFLASVATRAVLTPRQEEVLSIEGKVFHNRED